MFENCKDFFQDQFNITTSECLIKIQTCASGGKKCDVRLNEKWKTDPTTSE